MPIERLGRDQNRVRDTHFKKRFDKIDFARASNENEKEILKVRGFRGIPIGSHLDVPMKQLLLRR
jgi:hypothetical protein